MKPRLWLWAVVLITMVLSSTGSTLAFNGERQGFAVGLGIGVGQSVLGGHQIPSAGVQTDFKLGWGLTNQTMLYYSNRVSWFSLYDATWVHYLTGVGVSQYLLPGSPSVYVTGGLGVTGLANVTGVQDINETSFGFFAGMGYEFIPHMGLEVTLMTGTKVSDGSLIGDDSMRYAIRATVFGLAF